MHCEIQPKKLNSYYAHQGIVLPIIKYFICLDCLFHQPVLVLVSIQPYRVFEWTSTGYDIYLTESFFNIIQPIKPGV